MQFWQSRRKIIRRKSKKNLALWQNIIKNKKNTDSKKFLQNVPIDT